ncbi:hypothetical protein [Marinilactibacillus kalidii]|uniref:hypothetical protein n=1 Tax=Marinilactibacillus kalidii TaxID=2820274 RepID=UPI001ABEE356|nr:hypothetical protein [Marinilactibacillus kalidii]
MVSGYRLVFWGLILAHVNFTVGIFTVVPAFVGYMVLLLGYYDIEKETEEQRFLVPRVGTAMLVLLTFIVPFMEYYSNFDVYSTLMYQYYQSVLMLLELIVLHYILLIGISELERKRLDDDIPKFVRKDQLFLWLMGLGTCGVAIGVTTNTNYFQLATLLGSALSFIGGIVLLYTLSDFKNAFLAEENVK